MTLRQLETLYAIMKAGSITAAARNLHVTQPALLFHGRNDLTVPIAGSEAYAASHPNVTMEAFDADHELTEAIDEMWRHTASFLGI